MLFTVVLAMVHAISLAQTDSIKVGSTTRSFIVYKPSGLPENPPLVISMHGLGGSGSQQRSMSGFDKVADNGKFIVVYPNGTYKLNNSNGWDISSNADVDFISALIDTMAVKYKIDRTRVYATGFSMGGMMSYKLACEIADKITAIGPASGYPLGNMVTKCTPARPVPICHTHGTTDDIVDYTGLEDWISKFVKSNECSSNPTTTNPTSKIKKEYWGPCKQSEIIVYHFDGMYHAYPTVSAQGFSTSDTFWNFFKKYPLSDAVEKASSVSIAYSGHLSTAYSRGIIYLQSETGISAVKVYDVAGRKFMLRQFPTGRTSEVSLPVGRLSKGVYLLKVTGTKGTGVARIMISE